MGYDLGVLELKSVDKVTACMLEQQSDSPAHFYIYKVMNELSLQCLLVSHPAAHSSKASVHLPICFAPYSRPFIKMLSFTVLLAASALTGTALAKPIPHAATPKKGFTLAQSVAKPYQAGPVALQKTYSKYNSAVPDQVKAAAANGSVTATPEQYDADYLCPVTIGGQTLNLDFDTGSSDL